MGWYDARWANRKRITLTGTADGAQTNYQLKLTVYKSTGTDSGAAVYLGTKVKDDFTDLIFTKSDGITTLDYWVESVVSGTSAVVWIEFDTIPVSPNTTTFYLYYNNAGAVSVSNGVNTFKFFDDFSGTLTDKWTVVSGTWANVSGELRHSGGAADKYITAIMNPYPADLRVHFKYKYTDVSWVNVFGISGGYFIDTRPGDTNATWRNLSLYYWTTTWTMINVQWATIAANTYYTLDGTVDYRTVKGITNGVTATGTAASGGMTSVQLRGNIKSGQYVYVDDFFVANYTTNEPTWTSWGTKESPSAFFQLF